ncbi:Pycsar system effector family protein [Promicromonospora sp. NPDC059942]|uniref:Pycsar system effector family protein n=1 Tax=Promicromonospora sp. NPDC059942 TaxID=3347009 RepID=UPI003648A44E
MLAEARQEVVIADQKASVTTAVLGIGFGALGSGLIAGDWTPAGLVGFERLLWWVGAAFAVLAIIVAGAALWPRYTTVDSSRGVFYWGHVATFENLVDLATALDATPLDPQSRTRHQLWRLSLIVARKYNRIRLAMGLALLASILLIAAWLVE